MIGLLQPLYHGFLGNGLNIRGAEQFALNGRGLRNPEPSILWNIVLPRQSLNSLKQFIKRGRVKTPHLQKHTLRAAQKHVGTAHGLFVTLKGHTAILNAGNLIAQIIYFSFCNCLQTKVAWNNQFKCLHSLLHNVSMSAAYRKRLCTL